MLLVFAIALTPWSVLHHHPETLIPKKEVNCHHVTHVASHGDTCLICNASFEKNYLQVHHVYRIFLSVTILSGKDPVLKSSYSELLGTSLRGPPLA